MNDYKQMKKRAKALNKAFNNSKLILSIIQRTGEEDYAGMFGPIFDYYLCSKDKKTNYTCEEFMDKDYDFFSKEGTKIEQRYYFQAYNGAYEQTNRENGLDDISGLDPEVIKAFSILEEKIEKTHLSTGGEKKGGSNVTFVTSSSETALQFAFKNAPERLWQGALCEIYSKNKTPIKIGEKKTDYMMRIIENRIEKVGDKSEEEKEEIRKAGKIIADAYGSKRPRIAIIPECGIKDFKANFSRMEEPAEKSLEELVEIEGEESWEYDLRSGPNFKSSFGIALRGKVTPDKFESFSVPDYFELLQMQAIQRGAELGDLIDPIYGEIIEKNKEQKMIPVSKNIFSKFLDNIKNKIKGDKEETTRLNKPKISSYDDLRRYRFRRNWRNASL